MFQDVRVSNEMNERFAEYVRTLQASRADADAMVKRAGDGGLLVAGGNAAAAEADPLAVDIAVHVLTTGFWPLQAVALCVLPPDVAAAGALFKRFYLDNHSGRRLTFQTNMGTADVRSVFAAKRHELSVSTYQMVLLTQFNQHKTLTARQLQQLSGISPRDMWRSLAALCNPKHRILLRKRAPAKEGEKPAGGGQGSDDDLFGVNAKFRSKLYKIRVGGGGAQKEEPAALAKTRAKVEEDRKLLIESALVRIMKSRRVLSHNELVSECIKLLQQRFVPQPLQIKSRIESLIERDYLARQESDRRSYTYIP